MLKRLLLNDLKKFGQDFKRIYPEALSRIINEWQWTVAAVLLIFSSFYLDDAIKNIVHTFNGSAMDEVMGFGRWYGAGMPVVIMFLFYYLIGIIRRKDRMRETGLMVVESYVFSGIVTLVFKSFFGRWRPYMERGDFSFDWFHLSGNDYFSFFSGHSQAAFAVSVIVASTSKNIYIKILFYTMAVITGVSRIYHNQHWLSDVVTGALIAALFAKIVVQFHKERLRKAGVE